MQDTELYLVFMLPVILSFFGFLYIYWKFGKDD